MLTLMIDAIDAKKTMRRGSTNRGASSFFQMLLLLTLGNKEHRALCKGRDLRSNSQYSEDIINMPFVEFR